MPAVPALPLPGRKISVSQPTSCLSHHGSTWEQLATNICFWLWHDTVFGAKILLTRSFLVFMLTPALPHRSSWLWSSAGPVCLAPSPPLRCCAHLLLSLTASASSVDTDSTPSCHKEELPYLSHWQASPPALLLPCSLLVGQSRACITVGSSTPVRAAASAVVTLASAYS